MPKFNKSDLPRIKTYTREFIALTTAQLIGINEIAQRAAHETKADDQFNGGSIQYIIDEFFSGEQGDGLGPCDPEGIHCVSMIIELASDHYRLSIMGKTRGSIHPQQLMVDVDREMLAELHGPEYSFKRFTKE
jgi:hypothetical protein